jgi:hypothetical protein
VLLPPLCALGRFPRLFRWSLPLPTPDTEHLSCKCDHTAHETVESGSAWLSDTACVGVLVMFLGVVGVLPHAPSLTSCRTLQ